jgi:hypothetical protein
MVGKKATVDAGVAETSRRVDLRGTFPEDVAAPPNKGMQRTINSVTPLAFARAAPLLLAADPRC